MRESAVSEVGTEPNDVVPSVCAKACWFPDLSVSPPLVLCQARVEKKVRHKSIHVPDPETLGPVSRILWPQSRRARTPYPRSADSGRARSGPDRGPASTLLRGSAGAFWAPRWPGRSVGWSERPLADVRCRWDQTSGTTASLAAAKRPSSGVPVIGGRVCFRLSGTPARRYCHVSARVR